MPRKWAEEEDEFLRQNYQKFTGTQLGRRLGCSKNAIIGRAHRLHLSSRRAAAAKLASYKRPWTPGDPIPEHLRIM